MELERCRSGGWKTAVDFEKVRENAQDFEPDVDTEHLLVFHVDRVKCSLSKSSQVLRVRTDDREEAENVVQNLVGEQV